MYACMNVCMYGVCIVYVCQHGICTYVYACMYARMCVCMHAFD